MRRRFLFISLLITLGLTTVYWFWVSPALGTVSWRTPVELRIDPPRKFISNDAHPVSLELTGSGLERDTRAWLVPEISQRLAVRKALPAGGQPWRLVHHGNRVYATTTASGLLIVDVGDWSEPKLLGALNLPGHPMDLAVQGETVYIASGREGLMVVDCSDPYVPRLLARVTTPGPAIALTISGQTLYLACGKDGVQAIDVRSPARPLLLDRLEIQGNVSDVAITDGTLLASLRSAGVVVVDCTNPRALRVKSSLRPPGSARCVVFSDRLALIASSRDTSTDQNTLSIYRLMPDATLQLQSMTPLPGQPADMTLDHNRVTVSLIANGLISFDLTDSRQPEQCQRLENFGRIRSAVSAGEWLLLASSSNQLLLVNPADQLQLPIATQITGPSLTTTLPALQQFDNLLFVASHWDRLGVYDVSEQTAPELLAEISFSGSLYALQYRRDQLALGLKTPAGKGLLQIWSLTNPRRPQLVEQMAFAAPVGRLALGQRWLVAGEMHNDDTTVPAKAPPRPPVPSLLTIIDLSQSPANRIVTRMQIPADPRALALDESNLFAVVNNSLYSIQIHPGAEPRIVDRLDFSWLHAVSPRATAAVMIKAQTAILTTGDTELAFIDISSPHRLNLVGTAELPGPVASLAATDLALFVGLYDRGVMVYDISNPWSPQKLGLLPVPNGTTAMALGSDLLWLGGSTRFGVVGVPRPHQAEIRTGAGGERVDLRITRPQAAGDYSLWLERDSQWREIPNCIRFGKAG